MDTQFDPNPFCGHAACCSTGHRPRGLPRLDSDAMALLRLRLETGRTHQIRVHLQSLGCPIAGDYLYGEPLPQLAGRFALHAARMQLTHPMTGEALALESPLPEALAALLKE